MSSKTGQEKAMSLTEGKKKPVAGSGTGDKRPAP